MTRWGVLLLGVLWVFACSHTQEVDGEGEGDGKAQAGAPAEKAAQKARQSRQTDVKRPAAPGRPMLSTSPEGLMKPEGAMRIQKRLSDRGYYSGESTGLLDEATMDALKKLQGEKGLAKTGMPDRETLKALGLETDDVWRKPTLDRDEKPTDDMENGEKKDKPPRS